MPPAPRTEDDAAAWFVMAGHPTRARGGYPRKASFGWVSQSLPRKGAFSHPPSPSVSIVAQLGGGGREEPPLCPERASPSIQVREAMPVKIPGARRTTLWQSLLSPLQCPGGGVSAPPPHGPPPESCKRQAETREIQAGGWGGGEVGKRPGPGKPRDAWARRQQSGVCSVQPQLRRATTWSSQPGRQAARGGAAGPAEPVPKGGGESGRGGRPLRLGSVPGGREGGPSMPAGRLRLLGLT